MNTNDKENIGLKPIIIGYLLHWKLFLSAFVIALIFAIFYLIFYPKTYEIKAAVQIQEDKEFGGAGLGLGEAAGIMKSFGLGGIGGGAINLEDELQVFQSNQLFREMILDLGLNVEYREPYTFGYKLYKTSGIVLNVKDKSDGSLSEEIYFSIIAKSGKIRVKAKANSTGTKIFDFSELPAEIILPQGIFTLNYSPDNLTKRISSVNIHYRPASFVAEDLLSDFLIEDYSKTANIIELTCTDYEKQRGLDMLNELINCYNHQNFTYKKKELIKSILYFDHRIDSLVTELGKIEYLLEKYKQNNKLTDIQTDVLFYAEQMKDLQIRLIELESQSYAVELMHNFVSDSANKYSIIPMLLAMETGEKNPIATYNEILLERIRIIQNSKEENPLVGVLTEQVDNMRTGVRMTIENAKQTLQYSIDDLKKKEKNIFEKMGNYPLQEREFVDLKRQQEIFQGMYLLILQKREEAALAVGLEQDKARIIESPYVINKPIAPRKLYAVIGIFLFSIFIPVLFLFIKEQIIELRRELRKVRKL